MKREVLEVQVLREQATVYGVEFCNGKVTIGTPLGGKGSGLLVTREISDDDAVLIRVPADLVLSLEVGPLNLATSLLIPSLCALFEGTMSGFAIPFKG